MVDYKKNLDALKLPWVESPFFSELINNNNFSNYEKSLAKDFNKKGYVVIDLELKDDFIEKLIIDLQKHQKSDFVKTNSSFFSYNDSPRIVEAWKYSKNVLKLARHPKILNFLNFLYKKKPLPFSTINFIKGTEQPLHSDYIHFSSIPEKYLVGVWIALENTNKFNGPLAVSPKSHKLDILNYEDLGLKLPTNIVELDKCYKVYEDFVRKIIKSQKLKVKELYVKKSVLS